jgi:dTDP-glucose 4,6-dehydratase
LTILVTGGAGFIGANFVLDWVRTEQESVVNLDKLTYAGNLGSLSGIAEDSAHHFVRGDIADSELVASLLKEYNPRAIIHFAAESHVDRSIHGPGDFVQTNIVGTFRLLEQTRAYHDSLAGDMQQQFRFVNISTDEVYGSLGPSDAPFDESSTYCPNSPYSASKAAADHLSRSYFHTYGLPVVTTNCSNNYGPYQFPEKLIPLMILNGLRRKPLPIYGDGLNVRDWLYVGDHCAAIRAVLASGRPGETYNIGGNSELTNLQVVEHLCGLLDELTDHPGIDAHSELISYVEDRPGHDRRYAINAEKIHKDLGWEPRESLETGLRSTLQWYLDNPAWIADIESGAYQRWIEDNYANRAETR